MADRLAHLIHSKTEPVAPQQRLQLPWQTRASLTELVKRLAEIEARKIVEGHK